MFFEGVPSIVEVIRYNSDDDTDMTIVENAFCCSAKIFYLLFLLASSASTAEPSTNFQRPTNDVIEIST